MKRPGYIFFICLFFVSYSIAFFGCKKDALEVHPEFAGEWNSEIYTSHNGKNIRFDETEAFYIVVVNDESKKEMGKPKIKKNILKIGEKELLISEYPKYDAAGNYYFNTNEGKFFGAYAVINPVVTVSGTSATFGWTLTTPTMEMVDQKVIDYKPVSSSTWTTINCQQYAPDYTLTGLMPATTYDWRIKTTRETHSSQYSPVQTFTTQ